MPNDTTAIDRALMGRCLAYLFGAGALLAALTLPGSSAGDSAAAVASQTTYGAAALLLLWLMVAYIHRLPIWTLQLILALGTILISVVVYSSDGPSGAYTMFYLWIILYAFYFFRPVNAALQVLVIAASYAVVLGAKQSLTDPVTRWLIAIGTLTVAGILIALLKSRLDRLIAGLAQAAKTDALTTLLNRRGFEEAFDVELSRARRDGRSLSLILLDVDHFKNINDTFGHDVGDGALERLGAVLRVGKRRVDIAARIGGEEFAVLLPGSDSGGAIASAERLRLDVQAAFRDEPFAVTASLGIVTFPDHALTRPELMRAADQALYTAKQLGRDRVVVHALGMEAAPRFEPRPLGASPVEYVAVSPQAPVR